MALTDMRRFRLFLFAGLLLPSGFFFACADDLPPAVQSAIGETSAALKQTPTGRFIFEKAHPALRFTVRPMKDLGQAARDGTASLGQYRMDWLQTAENDRQYRIHCSVLAEVVAHEVLHTAQFHAGFFGTDDKAGFRAAVFLRKLAELQARLFGEIARNELSALPRFSRVPSAPGLWTECAGRAAQVERDPVRAKRMARTLYTRLLWGCLRRYGKMEISRNAIRLVEQWNAAYDRNALLAEFGRPYEAPGDEARIQRAVTLFLKWTEVDLAPDFFLNESNGALRFAPNSLRAFANGKCVREAIPFSGGYALKEYGADGSLTGFRMLSVRPSSVPLTRWRDAACEIPLSDGLAEGAGMVRERGTPVRILFRKGRASARLP